MDYCTLGKDGPGAQHPRRTDPIRSRCGASSSSFPTYKSIAELNTPQKLTGLISLYTKYPVSILSVPIQTVPESP
jgi:hypothetical protein